MKLENGGVSDEKRLECGATMRQTFTAIAPLYDPDAPSAVSGQAGLRLGRAQRDLYTCLGLPIDPEVMFMEVERWLTFFSLVNAHHHVQQGHWHKARPIILDLLESFSPRRRHALGIVADYGILDTNLIWTNLLAAQWHTKAENTPRTQRILASVIDKQYQLAIKRTGTPAPRGDKPHE